jgi:hypothetical protein
MEKNAMLKVLRCVVGDIDGRARAIGAGDRK